MLTRIQKISAAIFCGLLSLNVLAEDRVLIVGVGEYQDPESSLPGIDLDINAMRDTALLMGFDESSIKILRDSEATKDGIINAMLTWLIDDVEADDRVLFYFSGHGSRFYDSNGDEEDERDEALIAYDFRIFEEDGNSYFDGAIVDETLGEIISIIPSQNVMILIDACNSGTVTRTLSAEPQYFGVSELSNKYLHHGYENVPADAFVELSALQRQQAGSERRRALDKQAEFVDIGPSNYIAFTAARDDESAIATAKGSLFTLGLQAAIRTAVQNDQQITPNQLQTSVQRYITDYIDPSRLFHPQLTGNQVSFSEPISMASLDSGPDGSASMPPGTTWSNLLKLVEPYEPIAVTPSAQVYNLGDAVEISIEVPEEGYLNVITVDSRDQDMVLFPNRYHQNNFVSGGEFTLPTSSMNFTLPASEPLGQTLVVVVFSTSPLNLYESQVGGSRDSNGKYVEDFAHLSGVGTRAISVLGKEAERSFAASLTVNTVR